MIVLFYAMRELVRLIVFQNQTYLDAEVKQCAYNAKQILTVTSALAQQLALRNNAQKVDWMSLDVHCHICVAQWKCQHPFQ
jgi:hypothetical protein